MVKLFFLLLFFPVVLLAQTDWQKWEKKDVSYQRTAPFLERDYSLSGEDVFGSATKIFINTYWVLFSNLDGDNCPFNPTCSSFLHQAAKRTNPVKAVLMFTDRFTRDMNPFNRGSNYPVHITGKFYDPVELYLLEENSVHYLSPSHMVQ